MTKWGVACTRFAELLGDEELLSATTVASLRAPVAEAARRTVQLKGIAAPMELVAIDWR